jgi:hypothetical protein
MVAEQLVTETSFFCKKPDVLRKYIYEKEEERTEMEGSKGCPLFRRPESLSFGKGIGYCDMDGNSTNCDSDIKLCEKPDALKQYLERQLSKFEEKGN